MAGRVLEFSKARPSTDPSYPLLVGRLEEVLSHAKELAVAQGRGAGATSGWIGSFACPEPTPGTSPSSPRPRVSWPRRLRGRSSWWGQTCRQLC